jgi:two-component system sensor histidine kinase UhpB
MLVILMISILALIISFILFRVNYNETKKIKKLIHIRNSIARDLHDDIGATLSSISFSTQAVRQRIEQNKLNDALDILSQMGDDARHTVAGMSDIVWMVNPANDSFENLFNKIGDYARDVCVANQITIHFQNTTKNMQNIDLLKRRDIYFLCKEIINNAIKYAQAGNIYIDISNSLHNLKIMIKDDGNGFDIDTVKHGNGILNMKVRAAELKGNIAINSVIQKGTTIQIELPLRNLSS